MSVLTRSVVMELGFGGSSSSLLRLSRSALSQGRRCEVRRLIQILFLFDLRYRSAICGLRIVGIGFFIHAWYLML